MSEATTLGSGTLDHIEAVVDAAAVAAALELALPVGVRPRQLRVRTLLVGIMVAMSDGRPAHLTRVHAALVALSEEDRWRLGVMTQWKHGPHRLTYRQVERTFSLVVDALEKEYPDGMPTELLQGFVDALLEASIPPGYKDATRSLAIDWTDVESFARPPVPAKRAQANGDGHEIRGGADQQGADEGGADQQGADEGGADQQGADEGGADQQGADEGGADQQGADEGGADQQGADEGGAATGGGRKSADTEAYWGHRRGNGPGQRDELFWGLYLGLATMVREERGPAVPELVRSMLATSCRVDPVPPFVPVLEHMVASGVPLGDVLNDSGYSHRVPEHWALPLRALGAQLVMDLHPNDRGTKGTHQGAICFNGALYCPSTPSALFAIEPLGRGASEKETAAHDARSAELDRYRFSVLSADDADGYHRVMCPAAAGKLRCPRRQASMALSFDRPEILAPPEHPPTCCTQVSITVPPSVNAKTRQKHPYPSAAHRDSYGRRSGAERANSTIKDPASNDVARGWCRLMGLAPMTLMLACLLVVRNGRIVDAFEAKMAEDQRRAARGIAPRTRRRRRKSIADLVGATANAPP